MKYNELVIRTEETQRIIREIKTAIESISYGEVVITIHNSKVVQIEKREKKRFQS